MKIKVTKPNKDIESTSPRDFTIHSDYNMLKIAKEGSGDFDSGSVDITHSLGYKPIIWLYGYHPELARWYSASTRATGTEWTISWGFSHISNNAIRLQVATYPEVGSPTALENMYYKYFILIEPRKDAWYE
jgi:hypothetical protein